MDLPVEKWKFYVSQKWASLEPSLREKLCQTTSLGDTFSLSLTLFQREDEAYLSDLSRYYGVAKDAKRALACKEEGNGRFRKKDYRAAAVLYSRALSHTEAGSPEMAVCYANRSAALFHLGQFEVCLEDIRRAQEGACPDRVWTKILLRKAECLSSLGRFQEAAKVLASVEGSMSAEERPGAAGSQQDLLGRLQQLKIRSREQSTGSASQPNGPSRPQQAPPEPWKGNSRISCASSSVRLAVSPCKGRNLAAAKDILPGEILVREEAFVSVLRPGEGLLLRGSAGAALDGEPANQDLSCHHCLKALLAPLPCRGCSYAKYCSTACAQQAWESYHGRECSLGGLLLPLGVFCHLALRAVLLAGFAQVRCLVKESHADARALAEAPGPGTVKEGDPASIPGCDAEGHYGSSYRATFSLLAHAEKHSPELRFLCGLSVAGLCKALGALDLQAVMAGKEASGSQEGPTAAGAPLGLGVLGEAILRHMLQLPCNAQAVAALSVSGSEEGPVLGSEEVSLATALFPVLSLLNHSCDPNTSVAFSGRTVEVRASRPIPCGQEILHCYEKRHVRMNVAHEEIQERLWRMRLPRRHLGAPAPPAGSRSSRALPLGLQRKEARAGAGPHRCRMRASERRERLLSQYFFECRCPSCAEELDPGSLRGDPSAQQSPFCCPACHLPMKGQGQLRCSSGSCGTQLPEEAFQAQLRDLQRLTRKGLALLEQGEAVKSVELLGRCQAEAKKFLSPTHLLLGEIEDHMAQAHVSLGRWREAAGHLRRSIRVVEAHYGPSSRELGQELFKLAQVLFNGCAVLEALEAIGKAEALLVLHSGSRSAQVQELWEMKACLEDLLRGDSLAAAAATS